jgi:hypothetical protein
VGAGLPVGNVAYMIAMRMLSPQDREALKKQTRYQETPLGLLDTQAGRLVNTEREMAEAVRRLRVKPVLVEIASRFPR